MKAYDLCQKSVVKATTTTPLLDVARLMRSSHVGSVVVTSEDGRKAVGIVTDRDIVVEVLAKGLDATTMTAGDVMTAAPSISHAEDDALWALKIMRERGVRRLPVVDGKGELAGVLAFDDFMQHFGAVMGDIAQVIGTERSVEGARRG